MRAITEIIVHCTATRPDWWAGQSTERKLAEIRRWHVSQNGWRDIGYHYLIDRDGSVLPGRPLAQVGAHVQGRNANSIGISLVGGHGSAASDGFSTHFTAAQDQALRLLIADLQDRFGRLPVTGHNQYAAKACPGFDVPRWFAAAPMVRPVVVQADTAGLIGWLLRLFGLVRPAMGGR